MALPAPLSPNALPRLAIDRHALQRAKLVERLAAKAVELGITPDQIIGDPDATEVLRLAVGLACSPSITTWACLVVRLGGDI